MPEQKPANPTAANPTTTEAAGEPMLYCPNCSRRLEERGCKLRCARCGYYMSCSDYV